MIQSPEEGNGRARDRARGMVQVQEVRDKIVLRESGRRRDRERATIGVRVRARARARARVRVRGL